MPLTAVQTDFAHAITEALRPVATPPPAEVVTPPTSEAERSRVEAILAQLRAGDTVRINDTQPKADADVTAVMGQGILAPIERAFPSVAGVPWGPILVGGLTGAVATEVLNGLVSRTDPTDPSKVNFANVTAKVFAAVGFAMFGTQLMSRAAANAAVVVIASQVITDVLPFDTWVNTIVGWFDKTKAPAGLRQDVSVRQEYPIGTPSTDQLADVLS